MDRKLLKHGLLMGKLLLPDNVNQNELSPQMDPLVIELLSLGFKLTDGRLPELPDNMSEEILEAARESVWASRDITPVYPGFPQQVRDIPVATRIVEQVLHYLTGGEFLPNYPNEVRPELSLDDALGTANKLTVMSESQFLQHLAELAFTGKEVVTPMARESAALLTENWAMKPSDVRKWAVQIKTHERLQLLAVAVSQIVSSEAAVEHLFPYASSSDAQLRILLAVSTARKARGEAFNRAVFNLSNNDSAVVRGPRLPRITRRYIVQELARWADTPRELDKIVQHKRLWRSALEAIHPFELAREGTPEKYVLDVIFDNVDHITENSRVEECLKERNVPEALKILQNNPGALVRRLVALVRAAKSPEEVASVIGTVDLVAGSVPLKTLVPAYNAVRSMHKPYAHAVVLVTAGKVVMHTAKPAGTPAESADLAGALRRAMKKQLQLCANVSSLQSVPTGSNIPVSFNKRFESASFKSMEPREQLPLNLNDGKTLRFFNFWDNSNGTKDGFVDLGVAALSDSLEMLMTCSWNTWVESDQVFTYSGDKFVIVGDSAAEYIDCDLDALATHLGAAPRYLVATLDAYLGVPFSKLETFAGVMVRKEPNSGEVFEPLTVAEAAQTLVPATCAIPFIVDLQESKMIWLDATNGVTAAGTTLDGNDKLRLVIHDALLAEKITYGELLTWAAEVHSLPVSDDLVSPGQARQILGLA